MLIFAYPVVIKHPSWMVERHCQSVSKRLLECQNSEPSETSRETASIRGANPSEQGVTEPLPAPKDVVSHIVGGLPLDAIVARSVYRQSS